MEASGPRLSVVITSFNAAATIGTCLDSLRVQHTDEEYEVVLVDSSTDGTAELVRRRYPWVRLIESARRLHCGDARNRALAVTRGEVVAFLDADCFVGRDWVDAVLEAHRSDHLLVGGVVENACRGSLVGWAYHFCEYSLWLGARRQRLIPEMAGCGLSLKRLAYERYGPFIEGTYSSDTAFQWKARRDGHRVLFTPRIRIHHTGPESLRRFLCHTFEHRRGYARVRRAELGLSSPRRAADVALLPVTPLLLMVAALLRLRQRPRLLPQYLICAPLLFLGYCARSCGELVGHLLPPARRRFSSGVRIRRS